MSALILGASLRRLSDIAVPSLLGKPLHKGTMELGYYGSFTSAEVISGSALASHAGLTWGTSINSGATWDGFALDGKRLLIPRLPFRHNLAYNHLVSVGVVTGNKTVVVKGQTWRLRLLRGARTNPTSSPTDVDDPSATWGSEWNRLMYRLTNSPSNGVSGEGIPFGEWAKLSDTALGINGYWTLCQETHTNGSTRVIRGNVGVRRISRIAPGTSITAVSWKPVLELVE